MTIADIILKLKERSSAYHFHLYPPATDQLIAEFENKLNFCLPADIKTFYKFCNGFELNEDMVRIIPLEEIVEDRNIKEYRPNQFFICEYLIYGDIWEIEVNDKEGYNYTIFNVDYYKEKIVLTNSFAHFLDRLLKGSVFDEGGLYKWQKEIQSLH
ncbi:MAG: SMI1/KNR4 family protein [Ginsengibacter sp.]